MFLVSCKIDTVKFHNLMKASSRFLCKILQVKVHRQNKMLKSTLKLVCFWKVSSRFGLILIAKAALTRLVPVD